MFLGIEIGGTKLQLAVGDGSSDRLIETVRHNVNRSAGAEGILQQIKASAATLIAGHPIDAIGIGYGGPVDTQSGTTLISHQISGWENYQLSRWCRSQFAIPTYIDNDCNVAALAEAVLGAGRQSRRVFYVTVGTGIGGGLVVDGEIYGADRPAAAEIGHLRPGLSAIDRHQSVESVASGGGIESQTRARVREAENDPASIDLLTRCDGDLESLDGRTIAQAWMDGNRVASEAMRIATQTLGWAIAQVATITSPEVVVIGGGVSLIGSKFITAVEKSFETYLFTPLAGAVQIETAALGESVVLHGALLLAKQKAATDPELQ